MEKRIYGKWSPQDMKNAIDEYKKGNIGLNKCCDKYDIPKKTFIRHLRGQVKREVVPIGSGALNGRLSALSPEVEEELVSHILKMEELMFGMTISDIRKLAYDILESNPNMKNPFNKEKKQAGKKWYYCFMKRHPNLSLRQPESVSMARCKGFNKINVYHFFDLLEKIVDENAINALSVYNVDESGFSTVQKRCSKVVAQKGKKQVGALSSGERGVNTTLVACTSASGNFVPPMIIFKRKRMHLALANGAPPGSLIEVSDSGYINSDLFVKWLKHFISYVKPNKEAKVLLVLDGHTTHSKNLEAINLARENGVLILQLPGHTTHRLQPLDVAIFKPLETYYDQAIIKWMRCNPGRKVTQLEVAGLISEAYEKSATLSNAASGFRATGIWPVNRSVFSEADFLASENVNPLNSPLEIEEDKENNLLDATTDKQISETNVVDIRIANASTGTIPKKSIVSADGTNTSLSVDAFDCDSNRSSSGLLVPIDKLSPVPKGGRKYQQRKSKGAQKALILTSSPYKNDLEESKQKQAEKDIRKQAKTIVRNVFSKGGDSKNKRIKKVGNAGPSGIGGKKKKLEILPKTEKVDIEFNKELWYCFLCNEEHIEDMVRCLVCNQWAHEMCAGCEDEPSREKFVCDICSS